MLPFLVHDWVGDEEHVEEAVENRHVDRDQEHDEFAEEELEGTDQEEGEGFEEGTFIDFLLGDEEVVAGFFPELSGARSEEGRGVGFGDGEYHEEVDYGPYDELDPVEPSPAASLGEEAANEGT